MKVDQVPFFHSYDITTQRLTLRGAYYIPEEIFQFSDSIQILDISDSFLSELPECFPLLRNLFALFLGGNTFQVFPKILSKCGSLKIISFKNGNLEFIPENSFPDNLEWLVLTGNAQFKKIPDSIGGLKKLRKLALTGTGISHLPESLKHCKNLEFLRISACQFTDDFPSWLQELPKLAWFAGAGNPHSFIHNLGDTHLYDPNDIIIDEVINESPSSIVSRAHLRSTDQSVVIKTFKDALTSDGFPIDDIRASLVLGKHANIVHTLGMVHIEDKLMLISEPIPETYTKLGKPPSLQSCTRDIYFPNIFYSLDFIYRVLSDMASACSYMHAFGISHGDLYAHNILVDSSGHAILCDFGAATFYDREFHPEYELYDVRAFGHLVGELLERVDSASVVLDERIGNLRDIQEKCLNGTIYATAFSNVVRELI